jgi:S-phase kinase-associated protein 1
MVKCRLQCMSGKVFDVDVEIIKKSVIIKNMLEDLNIGQDASVEVDEELIPLPNITERSMEKIIEWCQQHKNDPAPPEGEEDFTFNDQIDDWDKEFLRMDDGSLFDLILAANYLDIKGLLDVTTTHVAHIIVECKTPEEIRKRFNIKNDLTPEDLARIEVEAKHWLDDDDGEDDDKPEEGERGSRPEPAQAERMEEGASASAMDQ